MKWASFQFDDHQSGVGILDGDVIYRLDTKASLNSLIADGLASLHQAGTAARRNPAGVHALESVRLLPPVNPPSIRDFLGYHDHFLRGLEPDEERLALMRSYPQFYFSNSAAVLGANDDVARYPKGKRFDYEVETAAIIGPAAHNISPAQAGDHIIGYTIFCDWSMRDVQMEEMAMNLGTVKGKDGANTLGPFLVTADELDNRKSNKGFDIELTASVNGRKLSTGNWSTIDWRIEDMVSYAARGTTLRTGDVIATGTVPMGCLYEHFLNAPESFDAWLTVGDTVTIVADGLGVIEQQIVAPEVLHPLSTGH